MTDPDADAFNARVKAMADFVDARLDEDDSAADAATEGEWIALDGGVQSLDDETQWPVADTQSGRNREDRVHIARHDPARTLREVAAKRSRVKELRRWAAKADDVRRHPDRYGGGLRGEILGSLMSYLHAVSVDAEIWSAHDAYDPGWRVGP